jgi:hypothetical protein
MQSRQRVEHAAGHVVQGAKMASVHIYRRENEPTPFFCSGDTVRFSTVRDVPAFEVGSVFG